ncbi:hypothetical protein B9Z19DRAFT_1169624 [Tuber borchii]|uniref:Uncharacterized protein n=1 Tax=Tuber borchii TaxID=42251 RepID=A0A2T6ZAC8_TUBBO|nr:hypothetical protein B9Z19DRAFT_1169624 [Tuber borchii]
MPPIRSAPKASGKRRSARNQNTGPPHGANNHTKIHGSLADQVDISTKQFDGLACRKQAGTGPTKRITVGKKKVDVTRNNKELEEWLDLRMKLLKIVKKDCEEARERGDESFRTTQNAERSSGSVSWSRQDQRQYLKAHSLRTVILVPVRMTNFLNGAVPGRTALCYPVQSFSELAQQFTPDFDHPGQRENIIEVFFGIDINTHDPTILLEPLQSCSISELDQIGSTYQNIEIAEGSFYLALDTNYQRIFAHFSNPCSLVFGPEIGQCVLETTMKNINQYTQIQPPSLPKVQVNYDYQQWLPAQLTPSLVPKALYGVYYWGVWKNPEHENSPPVCTPDITRPGARAQLSLQALFASFANITQVKSVLLGALDSEKRNLMRSTATNLPPHLNSLFPLSLNDCFSIHACSVNVTARPHAPRTDIDWEMVATLGNFCGGELCIANLKRSFNCTTGAINVDRQPYVLGILYACSAPVLGVE